MHYGELVEHDDIEGERRSGVDFSGADEHGLRILDCRFDGARLNGAKFTGTSYTVTQRISATKTVTFRVGVTAVGTRLVYLLANPSANFDFTDKAWEALVGRAAQRVTQYQ